RSIPPAGGPQGGFVGLDLGANRVGRTELLKGRQRAVTVGAGKFSFERSLLLPRYFIDAHVRLTPRRRTSSSNQTGGASPRSRAPRISSAIC
ncbi:MAG TPA: hypothetical protein VF161_00860, partial [Steroidobacteraceae bacterium]